jgi:spore germination protein YaaH
METMKIKSIFIAVFVCVAAGTLFFAFVVSAKTTPFYYGAWLPFWKKQDGATDISLHLDSLNEVSPFSYEIGSGGKLIDDLKIGSGNWDGWFSAVRDLKIKIIPTVAWFDGDGIYALLSKAKTRQAQEDMIKNLVVSEKFDGIDIDYESMSSATKPYFSLFIQGLAARLHPLKKTLACTIVPRTPLSSLSLNPSATTPKYAEDYAVLNKYCDEIRVMAYDQGTIDVKLDASKGNGNLYAPVADPDWVTKVLGTALATISPKKIMLGIPTYGYEYEVSWNAGMTTYRRVRSFTFLEAMDRADSIGVEPVRNNAGELSYAYATTTFVDNISAALTWNVSSTEPAFMASSSAHGMNTLFVSFPDAVSAKNEIALAKKYGVRGAFLFKADGQLDPATWDQMK